jgi:hypothetical protein
MKKVAIFFTALIGLVACEKNPPAKTTDLRAYAVETVGKITTVRNWLLYTSDAADETRRV